MTYRKSAVEKAGFKEVPQDFAGFLELCKALEEEQHAGRLPARPRLRRRQCLAALDPVGSRRLHRRQGRQGHHQLARDRQGAGVLQGAVRHLHLGRRRPGTTRPTTRRSWPASCYLTANGISIYVAAKDDPTKKELADDTYHALWPTGPVGKPTELQLCVPILAFNFTKFPQRCQGLHRLHAGEGELREVAVGRARLSHPHAQRLRLGPGVDRRPEEPGVQPGQQARPAGLRHRQAGREGGNRHRRLPRGRHVRQLLHRPRGPKNSMAIAERQLKRIYR